MNRILLIVYALSLLTAVSCVSGTLGSDHEGVGEVGIYLSADSGNNQPAASKSDVPELDINDFKVEIFNSSNVKLYSKPYSAASGEKIRLNSGEYTLLASYGDSLGTGFDAIYFAAREHFTVRPQTSESVSAVCRQANVKARVIFGPYILLEHPDVYARVVRDSDHYLVFDNDETRSGYIPCGSLTLEVYAKIDGTLKMYRAQAVDGAPNDFITFNVESSAQGHGGISVNITVNSTTEDKEYNQEIPNSMTPDEVPAVTYKGFDEGDLIDITEGISRKGAIEIYAPAGISQCVLEIDSPALTQLGVPKSVDLVSTDASAAAVLEKYGLFFSKNISGERFAYVNFDRFTSMMPTLRGVESNKSLFSLSLTDEKGRSVESRFVGYEITPVSLTLEPIDAGDVWASSVNAITAVVGASHVKVSLQMSTDGLQWTDLKLSGKASDGKVQFAPVTSLTPGTEYRFRAIYNGNEHTATDPVTVTTEQALQLGNAGFEDFTVSEIEVELWFSKTKRKIYYPYLSEQDRWWDVNSRKTMPSSTTPYFIEFKCTPTVFPSLNAHSGEKAVQVATINVNGANTDVTNFGSNIAGELFLGSANGNGDRISEGHSFESRPKSMSFWYKFAPYGSESFYAYVCVKNDQGVTIGEGTVDNMPLRNEWTKHTCPITYSDTRSKAASIYVIFKSSSSSSPGISRNQAVNMNGEDTVAHLGSLLTLDDVVLEY